MLWTTTHRPLERGRASSCEPREGGAGPGCYRTNVLRDGASPIRPIFAHIEASRGFSS
jgi:hypothetical protein